MDEKIYSMKKKYPDKVMVFGGISWKYNTPLISLKGNINAEGYIENCIERSNLIAGMNAAYGVNQWKLMQDGAPIHTCKETMGYLRDKCSILESWPANSPDLNPIENLWAIMKDRVEQVEPSDVWNNLEVSTIHNLINSVPERLNAVVLNGGAQTGY